ncbi:MAG: hypothetical protein FOGNACKC_00893 [Anaerolineae bacterium]|nr:hypothetical protein [Anaerolineae bacterium]
MNDASTHQHAEGDRIAQAAERGIAVVGDYNVINAGQPYRPPLMRPPRAQHFTDRSDELADLLAQVQPGRVVTLCGPGGIGKTALAAEAIWRLAPAQTLPERFPDGLFYYTFYGQPQADLALASLAQAFGEEVKPTPRAAARRALNGRTALLLLDGAEDADNLPAMLDVTGQCGVIITSRKRSDAPADFTDLAPLPPAEAARLLRDWAGQPVPDSEARPLCELVGHLPLAVRLAGRYLARSHDSAADYLDWLQSTPLEALNQGQRRHDSVPLLLERSLKQVNETARSVLAVVGLLALVPFDRETIAAALETEAAVLRQPLAELLNYGLLLRQGERYVISHALVLTYARKMPRPPAPLLNLLAYFTALAQQQDERGREGYLRLDAERRHLLELLGRCSPNQAGAALNLLNAIDTYLMLRGYTVERRLAWESGLRLTVDAGDERGQANCIKALGDVHLRLAEYEAARQRYEEARPIYHAIGDRLGEANCIDSLGQVAMRQKDWPTAKITLQTGLKLYQAINSTYDLAWSHYFLGQVAVGQGDPATAQEYYQTALKLFETIGLQSQVKMVQQALTNLKS